MQVTVQKLSPVLLEFDVQVDADRVHSEVAKAYNTLSKTARVKGFRPGKAPRKILRTMFGSRVAADVAQRLVDETFPKAVADQKVQPVSQPAIEPQQLVDNQPFSYKARFEVIPSIAEVKFDGLEAKRPKAEASSEQVDAELEKLRRALSTLESPAEERAAQEGDVLTVDVEVSVADEVVPEAGAQDFQADLGQGNLLPEIAGALEGKKVGDVAEAEITMPDGHPLPQLRGKKAHFKLSVKELKTRVLPDLDDEMAKDAGEFDTLDDLKKALKEQIEKALKEQSENKVAEQLVVELVKANPIPVPESLVQQQMKVTEQEILQRARAQGQNAQNLGDELRQQVRADAEVKVRAGLLMAEIAKKEGIKIGNAEIEEGIKELAEQTGKNVAKVRAEYSGAKQREMLVGMILENKVLDIIEGKAKIEDEK
jgi:trigger factor